MAKKAAEKSVRHGVDAKRMARSAVGTLGVLALAAGCSTPPGGANERNPGCTEQIHQAVADWLARWPTTDRTETLTRLAEQIVDRLEAGGTFYVAGEPGFCDELDYRAGGFAGAVVWNGQQRMGSNDVLLVGYFDANGKGTRECKPSFIGQNSDRINQALTIVVASARWPLLARTFAMADPGRWPAGLHLLDTDAPRIDGMSGFAVGQIATIAAAYALEGEMIAAATRRNRTLAVYPSIFAPGGKDFGDRIRGRAFLAEPHLDSIPAGRMACAYLAVCHDQVAAFCASGEPGNVRCAAEQIVACQRRGGTVLTVAMGHVLQRGATVPPELWSVAIYGSAWAWSPPRGLKPGDLFFYFGYLDYPRKEVDAARGAGVDAVTLSLPGAPEQAHVTNIRCFWKPYDGVIELPGYPDKALPSSGVVMSAVWYSLMEEARVLATAPQAGR